MSLPVMLFHLDHSSFSSGKSNFLRDPERETIKILWANDCISCNSFISHWGVCSFWPYLSTDSRSCHNLVHGSFRLYCSPFFCKECTCGLRFWDGKKKKTSQNYICSHFAQQNCTSNTAPPLLWKWTVITVILCRGCACKAQSVKFA